MLPARRDVVSKGWPGPNLSRKTKVSYLDRVALAQHVLGLDVSMKEAVFVHKGKPLA